MKKQIQLIFLLFLSLKLFGQNPIAMFDCNIYTCDSLATNCIVQFNNQSINAVSFEWDFGDGSPISNLANPLHTYANFGINYIVRLIATNANGHDTIYRYTQLGYGNCCFDPTPVADYAYTCLGNGKIKFNNHSHGFITTTEWNFDDGSPIVSGNTITHSFLNWPNTYDVKLKVSNSVLADSLITTISIDAQGFCMEAPKPLFFATCYNLPPGQVGLDNATINASWYHWDFGDGNTSNLSNPVHQYTTYPYHYNLCLTAGNTYGSNTKCMNINIHPAGSCDTMPPNPVNYISGYVFHDINKNCIKDPTEPGLPGRLVGLQQVPQYFLTNSNGFYSFKVGQGTYEISLLPVNWWNQFCPTTPVWHTVNLTGYYNNITNLNFADTITHHCHDLWIDAYLMSKVCADTQIIFIQYGNSGTVAATTPVINVTLPPEITVLNSYPAWTSNVGTNYSWNLSQINPGVTGTIHIVYEFCDINYIGDLCCVSANIQPQAGDCDPVSNSIVECAQYVAAYDPNDKRVSSRQNEVYGYLTNEYILPSDTLTYIIRFQNVGTATATHVRIEDIIDSHLDITKLQLLGSSHPISMFKIEYPRNAVWRFTGINLPDSNSNEPESHGFVKYRIAQITGNSVGTKIFNTASIYFDLLPPVITNTTVNTIAGNLSTQQFTNEESLIFIYPNPFTESFSLYIDHSDEVFEVSVYNISGQLIYKTLYEGKTTQNIYLQVSKGLYFIHIIGENGFRYVSVIGKK